MLTTVISFRNEGIELRRTVEEIRRTAGNAVSIHLINDASEDGYDYEAVSTEYGCRLDTFEEARGPAANRNFGADQANTRYVMFLDAHMRFYAKDWHETVVEAIRSDPEALYCTVSKPLTKGGVPEGGALGYGASVLLEPEKPGDLFLPNWNIRPLTHQATPMVPCVLGATYCFDVEFFEMIGGYVGLRKYGGEEAFVSMKAWMMGGRCRVIRDVTIGHIYRKQAEMPWRDARSYYEFNRLLLAATLFPIEDFERLSGHFSASPSYAETVRFFHDQEPFVARLRDHLQSLLVHDTGFFRGLNAAFRAGETLERYFAN